MSEEAEVQSDSRKVFSIGRRGSLTRQGVLVLECGYTNPYVKAVTGIRTDEDHQLYIATAPGFVARHSESLSRSGNGHAVWHLLPGIYKAGNVQDTSRGILTYIIQVTTDDVFYFSNEKRAIDELFPQEASAHAELIEKLSKQAQSILDSVIEERKSFDAVQEGDYLAVPQFVDVPTSNRLITLLKNGAFDRDSFEMAHSMPKEYLVHTPAFARGKTPEEAICNAQAVVAERAAKLAEAEKKAEDLGLPKLTGTDKQIKWAEQIRAKAYEKDPKLAAFKKATTARYWIDHRAEF